MVHDLPNLDAVTVFSVRVLFPAFTESAMIALTSWATDELLSHEMQITCFAGI